jgi:hypothetical protein
VSLADQLDAVGVAEGVAIAEVQAHAAKADGRDLKAAVSKAALLHDGFQSCGCRFEAVEIEMAASCD